MMTKTHAATGFAAWMAGDTIVRIIGSDHPYYIAIAGGLIAYNAAKAPDIDNPDSRPGRQINNLLPGLSNAINALLGHRGATHWIATGVFNGAALGVLAVLVYPPLWWVGLAVMVGWTTHIIGDCCTYQGAPAYGPFTTRPVRLPYGYRIECGGNIETTIVYPAALVAAVATVPVSIAYVLFN